MNFGIAGENDVSLMDQKVYPYSTMNNPAYDQKKEQPVLEMNDMNIYTEDKKGGSGPPYATEIIIPHTAEAKTAKKRTNQCKVCYYFNSRIFGHWFYGF